MPDSLTFAVDVFRTVCDRLRAKAADLRLLVEDGYSFEEWINWEAYLACKLRQEGYPFCEVTAKPTYASEGVATEAGDPDRILNKDAHPDKYVAGWEPARRAWAAGMQMVKLLGIDAG